MNINLNLNININIMINLLIYVGDIVIIVNIVVDLLHGHDFLPAVCVLVLVGFSHSLHAGNETMHILLRVCDFEIGVHNVLIGFDHFVLVTDVFAVVSIELLHSFLLIFYQRQYFH